MPLAAWRTIAFDQNSPEGKPFESTLLRPVIFDFVCLGIIVRHLMHLTLAPRKKHKSIKWI
jgi:hypothetical protein